MRDLHPKTPSNLCRSAIASPRGCFFGGKGSPLISHPTWHLLLCFIPQAVGEIASDLQNLDVIKWLKHIPSHFSSIRVHYLQPQYGKHLGKGRNDAGNAGKWDFEEREGCACRTQSQAEWHRVENSCRLSADCCSTGFESRPLYLCQCKNSSLGHLFGSHGRAYKNGSYLFGPVSTSGKRRRLLDRRGERRDGAYR